MLKKISSQTGRLVLDVIIAAGLIAIYATEIYQILPGPLQLVSLKIVLVSLGFIHAHLIGKLAFAKVDWPGSIDAPKVLRIALYVVVIYAYSVGG